MAQREFLEQHPIFTSVEALERARSLGVPLSNPVRNAPWFVLQEHAFPKPRLAHMLAARNIALCEPINANVKDSIFSSAKAQQKATINRWNRDVKQAGVAYGDDRQFEAIRALVTTITDGHLTENTQSRLIDNLTIKLFEKSLTPNLDDWFINPQLESHV